ncbi:hypothetical protein SCHPADRAFT_490383 [Schizopora paradoxa]|uniref:Uncharacterized protein n=1 Tax=Schizopora paradoxa TaxID=27342 RepID=A0A0H2RGR0_9AGAM|nr:hypothetical protein SCHPADRAFT_490383 [Schizopora paradoxa]
MLLSLMESKLEMSIAFLTLNQSSAFALSRSYANALQTRIVTRHGLISPSRVLPLLVAFALTFAITIALF